MGKELKMRAIAMLALATSMVWGMPSCQADCGKSSPLSAESTQSCEEPLPPYVPYVPYELYHPYDYMPLTPDEAKQDEQYEHVTLAGLTTHPERYDGKPIRVSGYMTLHFEWKVLCSLDPMAKCLWVVHDREDLPEYYRLPRLLKFHATRKPVFVRGIFDAKNQGHESGLVAGGIKDIVEVSAGNVNRVVFDDPSDRRQPVWTEEEVLLTNPIIADPARHDGKVVLVYGYIPFDPYQMCPSAELIDTENCIGLLPYIEGDEQERSRKLAILKAFSGKRAYVRGVFDASEKGSWEDFVGHYAGSIVKLIEIYEENGPVMLKPHVPNKAKYYYPASP
jgi:hypothetical protein